jgi:hypothetical protein
VHAQDVVRLRHPLPGVHVRDDLRACFVQMLIVVGVIEVPVRVDQQLHRGLADRIERLLQRRPRWRNERVDQQLAVAALQDDNVAARA